MNRNLQNRLKFKRYFLKPQFEKIPDRGWHPLPWEPGVKMTCFLYRMHKRGIKVFFKQVEYRRFSNSMLDLVSQYNKEPT